MPRLFGLLVVLLAVACQGTIGDPDPSERPPSERPPGEVGDPIGDTGLRRLSPLEVEATVHDLLVELGAGEPTSAPVPLPSPNHRHGFQNLLDTGHLGFEQVRGMVEWAESVSELATADLPTAMGCVPTAAWDACVSTYGERLGRLAFRRPLEAEELARFESVYVAVTAETTPTDGVRALWELALTSPDFWYLSAETVADGSQLTPHAIAGQLSYGLWGTMPDAWLRERTDELTTREAVREVADAMLDDTRAEIVVTRFHRDWLNLAEAATLDKDPALYPDFDATTAASLERELDAFVLRAVLEDRPVAELFASRDAYVNQPLESLYGLEVQSSGADDWHWRTLGPERAGVLTRPLFLATTAGRGESALIHRGVAIVEHLLCRVLTPPPNAIAEALPIPADASSGKLAAVEDRASKPQCATCHDTIDPLGIAFESFDAIGAFRTSYPDGVGIEPSGALDSTFLSEPIVYTDAAELLGALAQTPEVQLCYASKWSEWLTGTPPNAAQRAELAGFAAQPDVTIREILLQTLTSPWFLDRAELER
ncbi:MAG: DUF1592 domain-containing protein [Sandaracinus sp.]|nr:DUF1592 domain-containing protein [Sandaracinus sp.]MCB9615601.1 DUF1592 domain-containing protein [Sandaracinus sp.]MCB9631203.1 DUF1592 domain-containing protein [Sandaracinus sp.]